MSTFQINSDTRALIVGAGHGIGLSLVRELKSRYGVKEIAATYRREDLASELLEMRGVSCHHLDPTEPSEVDHICSQSFASELDLIIISVGALDYLKLGPEKRIKDFDLLFALENFKVNALVTPLFAKYLLPKLDRNKLSVWASLSAKVGSLQDNDLGGWFSYRASKAALNMYLLNMSIELMRTKHNCQVFALQPGTVDTELSRPYLKNVKHQVLSPAECAQRLLEQLQGWESAAKAKFIDHTGELIPW